MSAARPTARPARCHRLLRALSLLAITAATVAGCVSGDRPELDAQTTSSAPSTDASAEPAEGAGQPKAVVHLALTDWTGSRIVASIAEQIIERRLGHPVELVPVGRIGDLLDGLEDGGLDAVVEVWPASLDQTHQAYVDSGRVAFLGELGTVGKVGWYVPRYMVEQHPELATWEGYLSQETAELLATDETAPDGRFLGTNPAYDQADEELIESLGLPLTVVYSGSDEATSSALGSATSAGRPILAYWWTPSAEVQLYDLVEVELPVRDDDCLDAYSAGGLMSCDYPEQALFKLGAPDLADRLPEVDAFLRRFELTTDDQVSLLARVEGDGIGLQMAASEWVEANQDRWQAWLDQG